MLRKSVTEFRSEIGDVINSVCYGGEHAIIQKHGKDCVAVVSIRDLKIIEYIENIIDLRDAEAALAEGVGRPFTALLKDLGLDED